MKRGVQVYKYFTTEVLNHLGDKILSLLNLKYDKTGGEISGDVTIDGSLTFDIEDPDYDAGITVSNSITSANGTVMYLEGYIDSSGHTVYKPVIRNIGTPTQDYDAATKKYVDDHIMLDDIYIVGLDSSGQINTVTSTLNYNTVKAELTNRTKNAYLDVLWEPSRCFVKAVMDADTNNGPIQFIGEIHRASVWRHVEFNLHSNNTLTVSMQLPELQGNKTNDILSNSSSTVLYPTANAVYSQFIRQPEVIWQTDGTTGLLALEADVSANVAWQVTSLDMSQYKLVKFYFSAGGTNANFVSPAVIIEVHLDARSTHSLTYGHFVGSRVLQYPNDRNRTYGITVAVSSDKTSFAILRQTSLYGTAASGANDGERFLYLVEGHYA